MIARKYNRQIEIWKTTSVADGYGGNTVTSTKLFAVWANISTKNAIKQTEFSQVANITQTVFVVRNRYDMALTPADNFIIYAGKEYEIANVLNVDLNNLEIQIYANKRG